MKQIMRMLVRSITMSHFDLFTREHFVAVIVDAAVAKVTSGFTAVTLKVPLVAT